MEVRGLRWSERNRDKLAAHGISPHEADEVVEREEWVSYVHPEYPNQARIVGPTLAGRLITVVVDPTEDPLTWRVVTGWDATPREREYYREVQP